eukprot:392109-Pyramimonas_sp.AAC.1
MGGEGGLGERPRGDLTLPAPRRGGFRTTPVPRRVPRLAPAPGPGTRPQRTPPPWEPPRLGRSRRRPKPAVA